MDTNSGIHMFNLANHLTRNGVDCVVAVPKKKDMVFALGRPLFQIFEFGDLIRAKKTVTFELIHVWTPREIVRKFTEEIARKFSCSYLVHLEDNEEYLIKAFTNVSIDTLKRIPPLLLNFWTQSRFSHPEKYKEFLQGAIGITGVIDELREFTPLNKPFEVIWAGYQEDMQWHIFADKELRHTLQISLEDKVVVYTGNVHHANRLDVYNLYQAIWLLRQQGFPIRLLRTGRDFAPFLDRELRKHKNEFCIELGHVSRNKLPTIIALADILVQPGLVDQFNKYRFPSKLPEYLASGKPIILPRTNIGLHLKDKEECIFLDKGDALDMSQKMATLLFDAPLRVRIAQGGRKFAEDNLKWSYSANKLLNFYKLLLAK